MTMVKLFVANISKDTTQDSLKELFETIGPVNECAILKNFAFVHMQREKDAREALNELNGVDLDGQAIRIELSTSNAKHANGGERKSGGSSKGPSRGGRGGRRDDRDRSPPDGHRGRYDYPPFPPYGPMPPYGRGYLPHPPGPGYYDYYGPPPPRDFCGPPPPGPGRYGDFPSDPGYFRGGPPLPRERSYPDQPSYAGRSEEPPYGGVGYPPDPYARPRDYPPADQATDYRRNQGTFADPYQRNPRPVADAGPINDMPPQDDFRRPAPARGGPPMSQPPMKQDLVDDYRRGPSGMPAPQGQKPGYDQPYSSYSSPIQAGLPNPGPYDSAYEREAPRGFPPAAGGMGGYGYY